MLKHRSPLHEIATPRTVGIIGDPLDGTLSPDLQNALFAKYRFPFVYLPFRVSAQHLSALVRTMRLMDVEGLNVTTPHKVAVTATLDRLDAAAARIGAVNTIVLRRHRAVGYNTDAPGFLAALQHHFRVTPRGLTITLLGAGGTARAVADAVLRQRAQRLIIINRSLRHATQLRNHLRRHYRTADITCVRLSDAALRRCLEASDLCVQTTSAPRQGPAALRWPRGTRSRAMVFDVRYGPGPNRLLDLATAAGCRSADGLEMLIQQAAFSFTLWTGKTPDLVALRRMARRLVRRSSM